MRYFIYSDIQGQYRWRLAAGNNRIIAVSGEGYINRTDCMKALLLVMKTSMSTPVYEIRPPELSLEHKANNLLRPNFGVRSVP